MFIETCWVHATENSPSTNGMSSASPHRTSIWSSSPTRRVELSSDVAELLGEVDAGDEAAVVASQQARRATDAAADVEDAVGLRELGGLRQRDGGIATECVELLDRGQRVGFEMFGIVSGLGEPLVDQFHQVAAAVVHLDGVRPHGAGRYGTIPRGAAEYLRPENPNDVAEIAEIAL